MFVAVVGISTMMLRQDSNPSVDRSGAEHEPYVLNDMDEATEPPSAFVRHHAVKYELEDFGDLVRATHTVADTVGAGPGKFGVNSKLKRVLSTKNNFMPEYFDGVAKSQLPVINQNMCGSCWAISSAMAMKANLRLAEMGLRKSELPNLNYLIACSGDRHQIINNRNADVKAIVEFDADRMQQRGCLGGLSGMALASSQLHPSFVVMDVASDYVAGNTGTLEAHTPVRNRTLINNPGLSCEESKVNRGTQLKLGTAGLDIEHLPRLGMAYNIRFPHTSDVRKALQAFGALIVYVDIECGLNQKELMGNKRVIRMPTCTWSASHFHQSDHADDHSTSLYIKHDHAVTLVGWSCERNAWKILNSWGPEWGDDGALWVYDANVCKSRAVSSESYGAGPASMFAGSLTVFVHSDVPVLV